MAKNTKSGVKGATVEMAIGARKVKVKKLSKEKAQAAMGAPNSLQAKVLENKLACHAAAKMTAVVMQDDESRNVSMAPVINTAWQPEGAITDCLNGRIGSRTQVIHSILIDAAKRDVVMTTSAIQAALENVLGTGHGAAYAHLNTLAGKGSSMSHPCRQPVSVDNGTGPYVHHNDEVIADGWGLTLVACKLAGVKKLPSWLPKSKK
jgi:hypothetical protein